MDKKMLMKLREARENCGLSQKDVADSLKLTCKTIEEIESGNRNISTLELSKMARLYRRSISSFFVQSETQENAFTIFSDLNCKSPLERERLFQLAIEAYKNGEISWGRIFELGEELGIDLNILRNLPREGY